MRKERKNCYNHAYTTELNFKLDFKVLLNWFHNWPNVVLLFVKLFKTV